MGLVSVMMHINVKEEERNRVQAETIAELERTNKALQDAMGENAALHTQLLVQARKRASPTSAAGSPPRSTTPSRRV